jgi:hypothetical protein
MSDLWLSASRPSIGRGRSGMKVTQSMDVCFHQPFDKKHKPQKLQRPLCIGLRGYRVRMRSYTQVCYGWLLTHLGAMQAALGRLAKVNRSGQWRTPPRDVHSGDAGRPKAVSDWMSVERRRPARRGGGAAGRRLRTRATEGRGTRSRKRVATAVVDASRLSQWRCPRRRYWHFSHRARTPQSSNGPFDQTEQ